MSLAFLYNVASCIAYALVSAAYGSLYYVERRRGYLFVALTFLVYTIDIVLLFMYEFVPEFAMQFEGARNAYPMFRVAFNMVVILLYRLVLGSLLSRSFSPVEGFFWAVCMMAAWASGASSVESVALWREFLFTRLLAIWVIGYGICCLAAEFRRMSRWRWALSLLLVFIYALGEAATYLAFGQEGGGGYASPRRAPVEIMALCFTVAAYVFLAHHRRIRNVRLAESLVPWIAREYGLTKREEVLLPLLEKGASNKEIAEQECISVNTVKTHISNIYAKLGVSSRDELAQKLRKELRGRKRVGL